MTTREAFSEDQPVENMEQKRVQVTDRLQKREDDRVAEAQKRREEKLSTTAKHETADFFLENFARSRCEIETGLEGSDSMAKKDLNDHFDSLTISLQKLQKFTTDTAYFLPSYDLQKAQEVIAKLQKDIQEKRDNLIPKKKFAFKSKKKMGTDAPLVEKVKQESTKKEIKMEITECNFSDISSQTLVKTAEETNDKDVALARLNNCVVKIFGSPRAIHIDKLVNCKVLTGPVSGSIIMDNCQNCTFVMPCQQLRIHHTTESHFYIHVTSKAIIEDCSTLAFAPFNWVYEGLGDSYTLSGLDQSRNNWDDVDDFNWLANDMRSPNWSILEEDKRVKEWNV